MKYREFVNEIAKKCTHKQMKVTNSWGVYDAYKHIRKNKWYDIGRPLREHEFYSIIREINKLQASEFAKGNDIHFPFGMGTLELRKCKGGVWLENGKLKNVYPIDWGKTCKLWFEDEEARQNKILIRIETKEVFRVKYNKYGANYRNKCLYEFAVNRFIKQALKENIDKGKTDTLW